MSDYKFKPGELFEGAYVFHPLAEIGSNIHKYPKHLSIDGVCQGHIEYTNQLNNQIVHPIKDCRPIPITQGILEKAGFRKIKENEYIKYHPNFDKLHILLDGNRGFYGDDHIKYFHELQARIFWDSGREIMLNMEEKK